MPDYFAYFNGEFVPASECKISLNDSGYAFGHNVTESTRTFHMRPFKLEQHLDRLFQSMRTTMIEPTHTREELERITLEVLDRNKPQLGPTQDVWLVHDVTGGPMIRAIGAWEYGPATTSIRCIPLDFSWFGRYYEEGVHAVTPSVRQHTPLSLDPKIKHRNRLHMTLAELQVKQVDPEGFSILMDVDGNLTENKGGNFFIVTDGVVRTPTTKAALRGVSRETAIELARQFGIPVVEEDLQVYDAQTADECFFTSTSYCILPATKFNGVRVGTGKPGPMVKRLLDAWSELVGVDIVGQARDVAAARSR